MLAVKIKRVFTRIRSSFMSDEQYIRYLYKKHMKRDLDLDEPKTYNEKLQWLKLNDHNPLYNTIVDKYAVSKYVSDRIGEEYLIPLCGGPWDTFDEITFDTLPDKFVLKTTHDSGGIVVCKDKRSIDMKKARKTINSSLRTNYYKKYREWAYKDVPRRIIAEQFIGSEDKVPLDYKFFCFNGKPKYLFVATGRFVDTRFDFFDIDFHKLDIRQGHENSDTDIPKPANYSQMVEIARKLSEGFTHVRVDLYNIDGRIYFGEMTLYSLAGLVPFEPEKWDTVFGDYIDLNTLK